MLVRSLSAPVVLLTLLLGSSLQRAEVRPAPAGGTAIVAVDGITPSPALPGAALAQVQTFDAPVPLRTLERQRTAVATVAHSACARARAASLARGFLDYVRALERARLSIPATCGNPPPASAS